MRLFLDTSVLLAASGSEKGASRYLISVSAALGWELVSSDYCKAEARRNLPKLGRAASTAWRSKISPHVRFAKVSLTLDKPLILAKAKDRPVVITALATRSNILLTLDEADFQRKLGREVYGLSIATPGAFLLEQRLLGVL